MPENQNIEWKSKWKDEYLEWICEKLLAYQTLIS